MNLNPLTWESPWLVVYAALFVIVFLRAGATHLLGRFAAHGAERSPRVQRLMAADRYARVVGMIDRWGPLIVAASFMTVGLQTLVQFASGAVLMRARSYVPALIVGGMIWALIYSTVGFVGFGAITLAWSKSPLVTSLVLGAALIGLVAFVLTRRRGTTDRVMP